MQPQTVVNAFDKDQAQQAYAILQAYTDGTQARSIILDYPGMVDMVSSNLSTADQQVSAAKSDAVKRAKSTVMHALSRDMGRARSSRGRIKALGISNEVQTLHRLALVDIQTEGTA